MQSSLSLPRLSCHSFPNHEPGIGSQPPSMLCGQYKCVALLRLDWKRLRWIHFLAICQQSTRLRSRENCCSIVGERLEYMGSLLGRQSTWPCAWSSTWQSTSPALSPSHRYLRAQWTPLGRTALANPCIERQCASTPSCLCCAVLCSVPPHTTCLLCCFLRLLCYVLLLRVCCTTFYASCVVVFCLYVPLV